MKITRLAVPKIELERQQKGKITNKRKKYIYFTIYTPSAQYPISIDIFHKNIHTKTKNIM